MKTLKVGDIIAFDNSLVKSDNYTPYHIYSCKTNKSL